MTTLVDAPARADGLVLLGTMVGSGYRTPPSLVRRGDGQTLQLTPLLYAVLDAVDGRRSCAEVAAVVRDVVRRDITPELTASLIDQQLRPMGLVKRADGSDPEVKRSNPLLGLRFRIAVTDPEKTRRLTDPFRPLFKPAVMAMVVLGFLAITWWVFFRQGLGPAAYDAFQRPHLLLLVAVVTLLSGGFHEFGHAAAARYGGARPGVMGAGIYIVWPAFYTDVTDSYRLGRRGRIRTDLGGLYFNALVVVLTFVAWYTTGWEALLLLVATQTLQMVQQLMPFLRFDGYHLLADVTGVPDLYHRMKPTLLGLLPHRWRDPQNRQLKPWARAVITGWVLVTVPLMAFMLLTMVVSLPRLLGTAWSAVREDVAELARAWGDARLLDVGGHAVQVLAVALPVLAGLVILWRVGVRWLRGLVTWSRGSVRKRVAAVGVVAVVVTGLAWAWSPRPGNYRPIGPDEKGLLAAVLPNAQDVAAHVPASTGVLRAAVGTAGRAAARRLADEAPLQATFEQGRPLPSKAHPQLAMVLVPADGTPKTGQPGADEPAQPWVFPFDRPLPPAEGDNQAAAFNTTDDSTLYDVAFALVWATGDEVLNVNEAHAYASCSNCVTVAVAFQVVLIMDDAHVVVPQNLAVAANYDCYRCITAALASQLVLSVSEAPDETALRALSGVWARLVAFGRGITTYSLAQISSQLESFKAEIVAIMATAPVLPGPTPATSPYPTGTTSGTAPEPSASSPSGAPSPTESTGSPAASGTTDTSTGGAAPSASAEPSTSSSAPDPTTTAPSPASDPATATPSPDPQATTAPAPSATP